LKIDSAMGRKETVREAWQGEMIGVQPAARQLGTRYVILVLTTDCNLRCAYCYHGEVAVRAPMMSRDVAEAAISLAIAGGKRFHVQLSGGEPTLVPEMIEWVGGLLHRSDGLATLGVQTNGTLVDPSVVRIFKRFGIQVGVSLDGPSDIQDAQRGGTASTLKGLELLRQYEVPFSVTSVVTCKSARHLGRLGLLLGGFPNVFGLGLDLLVTKGRAIGRTDMSPSDPQSLYTGVTELLGTLEAVNRMRRRPILLREWETWRQKRRGGAPSPFCHAEAGESVAVHPDGSLFPCGQTLGDPAFAAGTVEHPDPAGLRALAAFACGGDGCDHAGPANACAGDCPSRLYYNRSGPECLARHLYRAFGDWERRSSPFPALGNGSACEIRSGAENNYARV